MKYFHVHQRLLFISIFFLVSTLATETTSSPGPSPNLQPVSSHNAEAEWSPTPSSLPPLNHISFPPSGSDAPSPSPSISPSSSSDSPDGPEDLPQGPDGEVPFSVPSYPQESETGPDSETGTDSEASQASANANTEVKKICESTDYPALCSNTINPLVNNPNEVSVDAVVEVSIKAANELAKAALVMARKLANTPGTPPDIASVLNDCKGSYDDALYNFERAMEAYDTRDVGTVNTMLSAVITDVGDCEDEFSSLNIPSPIAEFAEKLTNMTSNCLAIVSLLQY